MNDIFVSYASTDQSRITPLVNALESAGFSVFWDREIPTAKDWRNVLIEQIQSARCMIVVWTRESIDSRFVLDEADEGQRRGILFPVLLDEVKPPFGFGGLQAHNLVGWSDGSGPKRLQKLINELQRFLDSGDEVVAVRKTVRPRRKTVRKLRRRLSRQQKRVAWAVLAAPLVLGLVHGIWTTWQKSVIEEGNELLRNRIQLQETELGDLAGLSRARMEFLGRKQVLEHLRDFQERYAPVDFLAFLSGIPKGTTLTSMTISGGNIELNGLADSQLKLSELLDYLESRPSVQVKSTVSEAVVESENTTAFRIRI